MVTTLSPIKAPADPSSYRRLLTTTPDQARVLSARLAAEGVVCEVRGPSGPYPFGAAHVYVLVSDYEVATDLMQQVVATATDHDDDGDVRRPRPKIQRAVALVLLVTIVLGSVGGAVREIITRIAG